MIQAKHQRFSTVSFFFPSDVCRIHASEIQICGAGKGVGSQLPERAFGCFAQLTPDPFTRPLFLAYLFRKISRPPRSRSHVFPNVPAHWMNALFSLR